MSLSLRQVSLSSADDSQSSVTSVPPYSTAHQKPVYHMTPQDHNYSKQKSSGGETSDASCEVKEAGGGSTETDGSQSSEETEAAALKASSAVRGAGLSRGSGRAGGTDVRSGVKGGTGEQSVHICLCCVCVCGDFCFVGVGKDSSIQ